MGYAEQNLMPGEQIIYKARLHWAMFVGSAIKILFALLLLVIGVSAQEDYLQLAVIFLAGLIFLSGILNFLSALVSYLSTEFALTDRRVIAKTGWLRRRSIELLLEKIESIGVRQSILGRMLNFGTIIVTGTGGTKEPFFCIAAPLELRKRVHIQIAEKQ